MSTGKDLQQPWILERRAFLKFGGIGLGSLFGWINPTQAFALGRFRRDALSVTPRGSARNCLLVMLRGGPSHVDTFDLKVGRWTPDKLGASKVNSGVMWPTKTMPLLAQRTDQFSLVRTLQHQEVVHERAEYFLETGRRLNPGLRSEIPHLGAIVALESESKRLETDIFPPFMMFNYGLGSYSSNGFLSSSKAPFRLFYPSNGIANLNPPDGKRNFDERRAVLQFLDEISSGSPGSSSQTLATYQKQAEQLMKDPVTEATFSGSDHDLERYGTNYFGSALLVARNVFKADRGTRFIEVDQYGWDHHTDIYADTPYGLPALSRQLDQGIGALLDDLAKLPGKENGRSLLDETLVVVAGEFGRTVKDLNRSNGRDHYPYVFTGLFAGGGVKGGRVIGATDNGGGGIDDFGWKHDRPIHLPDLVTTIYSVLGIDWTKVITNTPSGRIYRYADPEVIGDDDSFEIGPLFE